jgi:transposase InsO family protein
MSEKQTGKPLKRIRTDEGTEFDNKLWREYLAEHGIIHEMTSPYSSSGNAVAERANRTIMDRVRTVLHDAGLPGTYWAEGAATIVYLKDFVPTTRHPGKTPHELWYRKKPDIAHLRPFGCTAYARVPEEVIGGKLNDRSIKCVLLGYFGRDGYRLLD